MLRLLFSTAAILPIGVISWMASSSDEIEPVVMEESYSELVTDPKIESLESCETTTLPIFFEDADVTDHSADFIRNGLEAAEGCGEIDVTVVPVLPDYADKGDEAESDLRVTELLEQVATSAEFADVDIALKIAQEPREEEVSTLYINGRAAILRIEPDENAE